MSCMSCSCTKQTFIAHNKEGLKMMFMLHNSSSFQFNLMPGPKTFWLWLYVCTKKYRKRRELTVKSFSDWIAIWQPSKEVYYGICVEKVIRRMALWDFMRIFFPWNFHPTLHCALIFSANGLCSKEPCGA